MVQKFNKVLVIVCFFCELFFNSCNSKRNVEEYKTPLDSLLVNSQIFYKKKDYKIAENYYDKIIILDSTKGEIYFKRAYCRTQMDNISGAIKDNLKAVSLGYKVDQAYYNLGVNYMMLTNDSLALYYFTKSYKANPNDEETKRQMDYFNNLRKNKKQIPFNH